jgi:hypothetical protein
MIADPVCKTSTPGSNPGGASILTACFVVLSGLSQRLLAAVVNTTVVADENLTVGSTVWLPAESIAPGR